MHKSFRFSPPSLAPTIVIATLIIVSIDLLFIAYGAWSRQRVFNGIQNALTPVPPVEIQSLREVLHPWTISERAYSTNDLAKSRTLFWFSRPSKLSLDVQYDVESDAIEKMNLSYFRSNPVDINTGKGLFFPMGLTYPRALAAALISSAAAILWKRTHAAIPPKIRLAVVIAWQLLVFVLGASLALVTASYFLF